MSPPGLMLRRVILGTVVGTLAAFAWAYVSWSGVRLYDWAVQPLAAEAGLASQIARAVPKDGAYAFPWIDVEAVRESDPAARRADPAWPRRHTHHLCRPRHPAADRMGWQRRRR